ncbi:MAG: helix-turn-helix transcriptional regulator [Methanobrevibacter sp.]|nr:helix-turn-helix transcriptional regulator [Methanobrevibacter sp.]
MNNENGPTMDELNFIFHKKWTFCILTDLHLGSKHFQDFRNNLPDLSTKVLNQTLNELEDVGLIEKKIISQKPKLTEYSLTDNGKLSKNLIKEYYSYIADISCDSNEAEEILNRINQL